MKRIIMLLVLFVFIIGCAKEIEEKKELPKESFIEEKTIEPIITCEEYCQNQPRIMCIGDWEISGEYPNCNCEFVCEKSKVEIQEKKETQKNPLDAPRVNSAALMKPYEGEEEYSPALCYLGAFAMLVLFDDKSLDFADVIAYSGIGSYAKYDSMMGLGNGYKEKSVILAAENLGYDYILGVKSGGKANSFLASFTSSASEVKYFKDENEAFDYLKKIIDSGKPVEVHLDIYHVIDDFRKISDFWNTGWEKMHSSHFMTVNGYDNDYVYINDPTEPDLNIKNMKTPVKSFLEAWKNGDKVNGGAKLGPYWTIYINKKGNKKSIEEIINWNKKISANVVSEIKVVSRGDNSELGVGRREFGKFLEKNNYKESGKLYQETADMYFKDPEENAIFKEIADKEEQARGLLK